MRVNIIENILKNKEQINEETVEQKYGQIEPENEYGMSITELLDHCADRSKQFYHKIRHEIEAGHTPVETNKFNPLFIGPTGVGKTSIVKKWAEHNGYEVITLNMMGDALDFLGVKTIDRDYTLYADDNDVEGKKVPRVSTVATKAFDPFLRGKMKILFLDEINKTNPTILAALYDLISFHTIQNGDEVMYLPKLLFTVGAMNPVEYGSGRASLDQALKARMIIFNIGYNVEKFKKFELNRLSNFIKTWEDDIKTAADNKDSEEYEDLCIGYSMECGRRDLVEKIFENPSKFHFTDAQTIIDLDETEQANVPRTFESAIDNCNGTSTSLIKWTRIMCGLKAADLVQKLLGNYRDKEHKANQIWGKDYSVKTNKQISAEDEIINNASEEDKNEAELETNLFRKLVDAKNKNI